jgi:hypothetical protein
VSGFSAAASEERIQRAAAALRINSIEAIVVDDGEAAKRAVLERIPAGAEVHSAASETLVTTGIQAALEAMPNITWLRKQTLAMDRATQAREIRRRTAAPDVMVGSVQALTEDGHLLTASATGSQLGPYASGAGLVIWVIGAQKIVTDVAEGLRRIEEHALPLESERLQKLMGRESFVSKVLITYREARPGRGVAIIVRDAIGA